MKRIALALALLVLLANPTWGGPDEALAAYQVGDYETALRELKSLAEQGNAAASYNLGVMYNEGDGVPQDDTKAVKWFRKAAEQGDAEAQVILGKSYADGRGVPQDDTEAVKWTRMAAEQGLALAQTKLGLLCATGRLVPQDYVQAHLWLDLAAEQGNNNARKMRELVAANLMTPAQIAEAQRLAREWTPKKE